MQKSLLCLLIIGKFIIFPNLTIVIFWKDYLHCFWILYAYVKNISYYERYVIRYSFISLIFNFIKKNLNLNFTWLFAIREEKKLKYVRML